MNENKIMEQLKSAKRMIITLLENVDENYIFDGKDIKRLRKMLGDIRLMEQKAKFQMETFETAMIL
ncbi:hypothetical protein [Christensenella intestinihominis]|uniref:hypothetical protein n=1 Tax=Christensenella intestinihominis TaxID=1851429 RepID=UPI000833BD45|nr:hypothetical protein [Christensenella intestinihominis]